MKKRFITLVGCLILSIGLSGCSSFNNDVVVKTDSGNITKDELYEVLKTSNGATVLDGLIQEKLLSSKYKITEKELNEELDKYQSQFSSTEEFETALTSNGYKDLDSFKKELKLNLLQKKAVTDGIKTSEKILKAYYKENKTNYDYVTASHILVSTKEEATKIKKQLDAGADFAELAKENSTDTTTAEKGGTLGEFARGEMVSEFEEVAFKQKAGTISSPVQTDYGFHIIQVTKHVQKEYEDVKEKVKEDYLNANAKSIDDVIKKLRKSENVEIKDQELKQELSTEETE